MPEALYQAMLFDTGERKTHWFYGTTNSIVGKVGHAKARDDGRDPIVVRMRGDGQFKGHLEIFRRPCNCPLHIIMGKEQCEREIAWWDAHAADRLPASELFRLSQDAKDGLYWFARSNPRSMAVMDWMERESAERTA